jgi:hypothetical protein
VKANRVMASIKDLVGIAVMRGELTEDEGLLLLSDLGDVAQVYVFAAGRLAKEREARLAWERHGIDRRQMRHAPRELVAGEAS